MAQMNDDMAQRIVANWERTKNYYGITAWEECQLARRWLNSSDALDAKDKRIKELEGALMMIAAYPKSRSDESSSAALREVARAALKGE